MNSTFDFRRMVMPRIKGETFSFPEKKNPSKVWWAWRIEVFMEDRNRMPIPVAIYYSFDKNSKLVGEKPRLYKTDEAAKKDLWDHLEKVKGILQRGFGGKGTEGVLDLRKGNFRSRL